MDIYDTKYQATIVKNLSDKIEDITRKFENKLFDIDEINCILDIIAPNLYKLKIDETTLMSEFDIIEKFNKIHYPTDTPVRYNKHELKMIESMYRLKKTYVKCRQEKSRIVLNDKTEETETNKQVKIKEKMETKKQVKSTKKEKENIVVMYCVATKMDGTICNCKTKKNSNLCGRHSKK